MTRYFLLPCFFLWFLFSALPQGVARAEDLPESFLAAVKGIQSIQTTFVMETHIPMFTEPMRAKGVLLFQRPDALLWEYQEPFVEGFCVKNKEVVRWEGARSNIAARPTGNDQVSVLLAKNLLLWIALDIDAIGREYDITVANTKPISLNLTPKSKGLREILAGLTIVFQDGGVAKLVTIRETQGGTTTILFVDTVINADVNPSDFPQR